MSRAAWLGMACLLLAGCWQAEQDRGTAGAAARPGGGLVAAGWYSGPLTVAGRSLAGRGRTDLLLAAFDGDGSARFGQRIGGLLEDGANAVVVDAGGRVTVAGWFRGAVTLGAQTLRSAGGEDILVACFTPEGRPLWARGFGGSGDDAATALAISPEGHLLITGRFQQELTIGRAVLRSRGREDVFLLRLSAGGEPISGTSFGGPAQDVGLAVAVAPDGEPILSVISRGAVRIGSQRLPRLGTQDTLLVRLSPGGAPRWARRFSGRSSGRIGNIEVTSPSLVSGRCLAVDRSGAVVLAGSFSGAGDLELGGSPLPVRGSDDIFVARFSPEGNHVWSRAFGGSGQDVCQGLAVDREGGVLLTGWYAGPMPIEIGGGWFSRDVTAVDFGGSPLPGARLHRLFLARLGPDGGHRWSRHFGGTGPQAGRAVAIDDHGRIWLTGTFHGRLELGGRPLASRQPAVFVAGFTAAGDYRWGRLLDD